MKKVISVFILLLTWQIGISQDFPPPTSLNIIVDNDSVYFSWQAPESKSVSHYNIYYNGCLPEEGFMFQVGETTNTIYSQALPIFHNRMNFGISAEYLDPVGESEIVWEYLIVPTNWSYYVQIDFEDPSDYGDGLATCVFEGNDDWKRIDSDFHSQSHCAEYTSDEIGSKSSLVSAPVPNDGAPNGGGFWFWAKVPEVQGLSDTLELFLNGYSSPIGPIYAINGWQYFEIYIEYYMEEYLILDFQAKCGGGAGIYVDDISVFEFTSVQNFFNRDLHFKISPNPATSLITISSPDRYEIEEAIIYNHLGQKVLTAKPVNNTVDISGLNAGMYMIEVRAKEYTGRQKLIKQ
jgi:hypothetical protein